MMISNYIHIKLSGYQEPFLHIHRKAYKIVHESEWPALSPFPSFAPHSCNPAHGRIHISIVSRPLCSKRSPLYSSVT